MLKKILRRSDKLDNLQPARNLSGEHKQRRSRLDKIISSIAERLAGATGLDPQVVRGLLEVPPNSEMGDLAMPCFRLAKELGKKPPEIAAGFAAELQDTGSPIAGVSASGPYLNITLDRPVLAGSVLGGILSSEDGRPATGSGAGRTAVLEFSSPNIAKPFSIALLRGTALGAALARIHEALSWKVVRCNYFGDWGTQFGKVIVAFRKWGSEEALQADPIKHLLELYVRFAEEVSENPDLEEAARAVFKKLEDGGEEELQLWKRFRDMSLAQFEKIYARLGISYDCEEGEAHYRQMVPTAVEFLTEKGLLVESQGARVVNLEDHKLGVMLVLKSDDASIYASRDMAAVLDRQQRWKFDKLIYVVGADQKLHFRQLFKTLELAGCQWVGGCSHVDFGMVLISGEKMSTRRGKIVLLEDVLADAGTRAREIIDQKNPGLAKAQETADAVGQAAVLFASLSVKRNKTVDFVWERIVNFEGETGPYLQYTHARFCSVLRKAGAQISSRPDYSLLSSDDEHAVVKQLGRMVRVLERAAAEGEPSLVCSWLLELASSANNFYNHQRVIGDDPDLSAARLALVDCIRKRLRAGLEILGIAALEEM
jgi:arginyl-tRNA synthetase